MMGGQGKMKRIYPNGYVHIGDVAEFQLTKDHINKIIVWDELPRPIEYDPDPDLYYPVGQAFDFCEDPLHPGSGRYPFAPTFIHYDEIYTNPVAKTQGIVIRLPEIQNPSDGEIVPGDTLFFCFARSNASDYRLLIQPGTQCCIVAPLLNNEFNFGDDDPSTYPSGKNLTGIPDQWVDNAFNTTSTGYPYTQSALSVRSDTQSTGIAYHWMIIQYIGTTQIYPIDFIVGPPPNEYQIESEWEEKYEWSVKYSHPQILAIISRYSANIDGPYGEWGSSIG